MQYKYVRDYKLSNFNGGTIKGYLRIEEFVKYLCDNRVVYKMIYHIFHIFVYKWKEFNKE
jgi:hypothetical protein